MSTKSRAQIHMDDTIVKDPELEKMLEDRQELKLTVGEYRKVDKACRERIKAITTATPYRVGRFIISKHDVSAKSVSFETQASFAFTIKLISDD